MNYLYRTANGGGILVLIRDTYRLEYYYEDDTFETIIFSIFLQKHKVNFIISYNPRLDFPGFLDHLDNMLHKVNLNYSTLIIGDLNHDMLNKNKHAKLSCLLSNLNFINYVNKPTRIRDNSQTLLDVIFSNNSALIKHTDSIFIPPEISDHCVVLSALNFKATVKNKNLIQSRCLNLAKLNLIKEALKLCDFQSVLACKDIDTMFLTFKYLVIKEINSIAPIKNVRIRVNNAEWVDEELRRLFRARDILFQEYKSSGCSKTDEHWLNYVVLRNKCKSLSRKKFSEFFKNKSNTNLGSNKFWSLYKSIIKTKSSTGSNIYTIKNDNNLIISEEKEVSNIFNNFFSSINNNTNKIKSDDECVDFIHSFFHEHKRKMNINCDDNFCLESVDKESVKKLLLSLKNSSSAGVTAIPTTILKHCAEEIAPVLCHIFNFCLINSTLPLEWKHAIVTPLFKKGDNTVCDNFRGISVISPLAKLFEKIVSKQILNRFDKNKLFSKRQHGFKSNYSCETALQTLLDNWRENIDLKKIILTLFIDFKKAFDLINPKLLIL